MSELIPTTADVRDAYSAESSDSKYANRMFDLWLANYKAKVIAKTEERIIKLLEEHVGFGDAEWDSSVLACINIIKGEKK